MIGLGREGFAKTGRRVFRGLFERRVVGIAEATALLFLDQRQELTFLDYATFAHDADRDISALVKCIDRVDKGCGQLVIDADGHGQQPA